MFGLSRRAPATRVRRPFRKYLWLDDLEGRYAPSDIIGTNQAPRIEGFAAQEISNGVFVLTGRVIDEAPGGLTVSFGGTVPSAVGRSCVTTSNGTFSIVMTLRTDGSDVGTITARVTDVGGLSGESFIDVHPTP